MLFLGGVHTPKTPLATALSAAHMASNGTDLLHLEDLTVTFLWAYRYFPINILLNVSKNKFNPRF